MPDTLQRRRCIVGEIAALFAGMLLGAVPVRQAVAADVAAPLIVPKPAEMTLLPTEGRAHITSHEMIVLGRANPAHITSHTRILVDGDKETEAVGQLLSDWLFADTGLRLSVQVNGKVNADRNTSDIIISTWRADQSLGREGYSLAVVNQMIVLRAPHAAGLFYGAETIRQLLPPPSVEGGGKKPSSFAIPALTIRDKPRFAERSLMIDSARHFQSIAFLKRTIALLAYHKMNTLHWHLTDDQGWRLEIKQYPKLTEVGAYRIESGHRYGEFYTQEQVRDLVAYAASYHVTIVPEIDMPAHCLSLLAAYPENACFPKPFAVTTAGIGPGAPWTPDILCAGREATYTTVENILTEVMALFPSVAIHIGGDECPTERWHACPVCQAKMKAEGLANERALQNYFTRRIAAFLTAHGRRLQGWNEIEEGGDLPKDVIVEPWNRPETAAAAVRSGNDVVVGSTRYAYFDYSDTTTPLRRTYSWNPMPDGLTPEQAARVQGCEACLWTEGKKDDAAADRFAWPRTVALAEVGWSPEVTKDWVEFRVRLERAEYPRLARMGLGDPASVKEPGATFAALVERSDFDPGVRMGTWVPAQMSESVVTHDWDATPYLTGPGNYRVRFDYQSGNHAMAISEADIVQLGTAGAADVIVAKDVHDGWAGGAAHDQTYRFAVPALDSTAHYVLRVHLRSDGGTDSHGEIFVTKVTSPAVSGR